MALDDVRGMAVGPQTFGYVAVNQTLTAGIAQSTKRVLVDQCSITATGAARAIEGASGIVRGCYLTSNQDGLTFIGGTASAPSLVEDCHILGPGVQVADYHQDAVQLWTGGHLEIRRSVLTGWMNSAVLLKTDVGPIDSVVIDSCVLACGTYYPVYVRDGGFGRPTNITVTNCVFDAYNGPTPISTGSNAATETKFVHAEAQRTDPTWVVWNGNTKPDGTPIPPPGGWLA